jgi:hypothetical protein
MVIESDCEIQHFRLTYELQLQVLRNKVVSKEVRKARAHALHELGGIFLDAAASHLEAVPAQDQVGNLVLSILSLPRYTSSRHQLVCIFKVITAAHNPPCRI